MAGKQFFLLIIFCYHLQIQSFGWHIEDMADHTSKQCVIDLCTNFSTLDDINFCFFGMPELLKYAQGQNLPVILRAQKNLHGYGPLDEKAYEIEPVRTALTWARVFAMVTPNVLPFTVEYYAEKIDSKHHSYFSYEQKKPVELTITLPEVSPDKKRYLITGGAGFIGSHLTKKLLSEGHQVIVLDNLSCCTGKNIVECKDNKNFCFVQHDVAEPFQIDGDLDVVVHLASVPSPVFYYKMPVETLRVGLDGTKNCLEIARKKNARFLFTSTSEVYGDPEIHPQSESYAGLVDYLGKRSQYDQSKRGAETLCKYYYDHYTVDVRIVRIFNTYGPGMHLFDGRVVTNFIASLLENKPMTIYGNGLQTRSFAYVDDTVEGIYKVLINESYFNFDQPCSERVFNIGNVEEYAVLEVAEMVKKIVHRIVNCSSYPTILHVLNPDVTDPRRRRPDITRATLYLGFKPLVSLRKGLKNTFIYFYKNFVL